MFCSYWFVSWLAVIFYNWKDHCSGRHNLICSCEMKAWKNSWCQCSILINNELASQQSSLHYLFSRLWVVAIFPQFFAQNSREENRYLGFLFLAINIPRSLLMTKVITAEWEKESRWMHLSTWKAIQTSHFKISQPWKVKSLAFVCSPVI